MQYHASLITADGAYHCPVGSIMAIFSIENAQFWPVFAILFANLRTFGVFIKTLNDMVVYQNGKI